MFSFQYLRINFLSMLGISFLLNFLAICLMFVTIGSPNVSSLLRNVFFFPFKVNDNIVFFIIGYICYGVLK